MSSRPESLATSTFNVTSPPIKAHRGLRRIVVVLLIFSTVLTVLYAAISLYIATQLVYVPQKPLYATPASQGLQFQYVTFPSRVDHILLRGWFIPGVLPNGKVTTQRAIVFVHGARTNRSDKDAGLLNLSSAIAKNGFAVLAFDMRGSGESPPAAISLGYFEQRDVLGAVDFLRSGPLPYPALGRPRVIGGWGVSMGAATLIMATAQEPSIRAIVSDCAFADIIPILERVVPSSGHLPAIFTPGALLATQALYGVNFYADRPVDYVAQIAPRPILFIHGASDKYIPPSNMDLLAAVARSVPNAHVQTWSVPGAGHAQSFNMQGKVYVDRVVAFYTAALGLDSGAA